MPGIVVCGAAALLVLWPLLVSAQKGVDYRAVGDSPAILYDAPSLRGKKLFVAPRGMPLEVVVSIEGWLKVRDRAGDLTWIERRAVVERRTVVTAVAAQLRDRPEDGAPVVVELAAEVVLDLLDPAPAGGWLRVRHRDGAAGFIRASQVWGV